MMRQRTNTLNYTSKELWVVKPLLVQLTTETIKHTVIRCIQYNYRYRSDVYTLVLECL